MNILLILPKDRIYHYRGLLKNNIGYAPLTLTTLAGLVPEHLNAHVDIVDEGVQKPYYEAFYNDKKHYDLVGITCTASSSPRAYQLAVYFRKQGVFVVLGGSHPTLVPEEAAQYADSVIVGPGELTWPQLLTDYKNGETKKFYHHTGTDKCTLSMPVPRRDIQPKGLYMPIPTIIANRGCRNNCSFCTINHIYGSKSLYRPIEEVVSEIKQLKSRKLLFLDPSPNSDKEYAKKFYEALIPLKVKWMGLSTMDIVYDRELFDLMVRSGCDGVLVGLESFTQANNDESLKKLNDVKKYKEVVEIFHKNKVRILGHFIIGFDNDTKESIEEMLDIIDDIGIDLPRFTVLTPFPGTRLYERMKEEGRIITDDRALYDTENVVFKPKNMSPLELQELYHKIKKEAYSNKRIFKRSFSTQGNKVLTLVANVGFRFLQNDNVLLALFTNLGLKVYSRILG
ncbi:MAG: B12-binding domain-containing radical SAM protein [Clostridiaceae bacterium]|nr:B12-binding domain-containing radical SAM protein [Clostridiaceae bacterium]